MLTSSLALLLACSAFVAYDTLAFRHQLVDQVSALAGVIGNNCAAAIDFNDPKSASETLAALAANKNIVSACAYGPRGDVFATYERSPGSPPPPRIRLRQDEQFAGNELHLWRPIKQSGLVVGTIFVASDLNELSARLARYINIVAIVFATSLLVAFIITSRLQHLISDPILHLHGVTRAVAVGKDYSVRAIASEDELGQLMDGFNDMLSQIQQHDANLERRVSERTRELEQENSERKAAEVELAYERELLRSPADRSLDRTGLR
ncbi:MAG: CHASE sensor domain-containing protein [Verrucomicrobiota bacterium]